MTQANEPAIGESANMYLVDSFATNYAGVTGSGVTWDYSDLAGYTGQSRTIQVVDPATTSNATDFPTSTKAYDVGGSIMTYFTSTATDRTSQGFRFTEPSLGDVVSTYDNDELIMCTYPFALGSSVTDAYDGNVSFNAGIPTTETLNGNAYAWIDGQGTLSLPFGTNVTNVIRYKSIDTAYSTAPIIGAVELIREQYEYYEHGVMNLPIFLHAKITMQQPGGAPLGEVALVLSYYPTEEFVGLNESEEVSFSVYPNPANNVINISGNFDNDATVTIFDQSGRVVKTITNNISQIDIADVDTGIYLLSIESNGETFTKQIVKQ